MKIKVTAIILVVILTASVFLFQGCIMALIANSNKGEAEEETRLFVGFRADKFLDPFVAGVYADTKVFDIDDVTLKFCYGGEAPEKDYVEWHMAMYVSQEGYEKDMQIWVEDYKDIPGFYMLAEKTQYEFNHRPFDMTLHYTGDLYFHFKEEWTVPREYFSNPRGYFIFWVMPMYSQDAEDGSIVYRLVPQFDTARRIVYYRVEGDKVKLAENAYELEGDASDWAGSDESNETGQDESGEN